MSISRVIRHFEGLGQVPVSIEDVKTQIQSIVIDERIEVHGVDRPFGKLRGIHNRYKIPAQEGSILMDEPVVEVIYSIRQPLVWQRIVCCKELVHMFDREPIWTRKKAEILKLGENLVGTYPVKNSQSTNSQFFFDEMAKYQALAILFPFGLREELESRWKDGSVSAAKIARAVQRPNRLLKSPSRAGNGLFCSGKAPESRYICSICAVFRHFSRTKYPHCHSRLCFSAAC